jgi:septal ring-binding cell division protein DamX
MSQTLYVKGPLGHRVKDVLYRAGEEVVEAAELAEDEIQDLLKRGILTTEKPANAVARPATVTNPAALSPTAGYSATAEAADPFANSPANNHASIEQEDAGLKAAAASSEINQIQDTAQQQQAAAASVQVDPATGQPVQAPAPQIDPATGQPVQQLASDPNAPQVPPQPTAADVANIT